MTDPPDNSTSPSLDAGQIAAQAAALARHLQASGVAFVPHPDAGAVDQWRRRLRTQRSAAADQPAAQPSPAPSRPTAKPTAKPATTTARPAPAAPLLADVEQNYPGEPLTAEQRAAQLQVIEQQVSQCTRCPQLSQCRTQTVFGEGSVLPRVAFFGEGPGADEDRSGRPFVGKAGQLLTKMIEACKMRREEVYIFNTVKCRPPGNRNPEPEEISNCREYFEQQLQILRPEYIVCLGAVASQTLLQSKLSVGRLRGTLHTYFESKVLVTYHPAYLLRNASAKKYAWQDLQLMLRDAGLME
jgi:DNA polymerase